MFVNTYTVYRCVAEPWYLKLGLEENRWYVGIGFLLNVILII